MVIEEVYLLLGQRFSLKDLVDSNYISPKDQRMQGIITPRELLELCPAEVFASDRAHNVHQINLLFDLQPLNIDCVRFQPGHGSGNHRIFTVEIGDD